MTAFNLGLRLHLLPYLSPALQEVRTLSMQGCGIQKKLLLNSLWIPFMAL